MSAPSDTQPGNGSLPDGADPLAGTAASMDPTHGTEETPVEPGSMDSPDVLRRKASHNEEIARSLQSRKDQLAAQVTELEGKLNAFGGLTPEQVISMGGADFVAPATSLAKMLTDSTAGQQLIQRLQGGMSVDQALGSQTTNPDGNGTSNEDDLYLSETERALKTQLQQVTEKLDSLERNQGQANVATGQQVLSNHLTKLFETEFSAAPEALRKKMFDGVKKSLESNPALQGPAGEQTLRTLMGPNGLPTARTLMLSTLTGKDITDLGKQSYLQEQGLLRGAETDSPSGERSNADVTPAAIPKNLSRKEAALMAFQQAEQTEGKKMSW